MKKIKNSHNAPWLVTLLVLGILLVMGAYRLFSLLCELPSMAGAGHILLAVLSAALALGGEAGHAFYYQTHSQASWAEARDLRDESLLFYPNGAGTVEAWFKPDWPAFMKKSRNGVCRLFHTQQLTNRDPKQSAERDQLVDFRQAGIRFPF